MRNRLRSPRQEREGGFSLIELLIVVAIIVTMAAVALPNIMGYLRLYKIRGATQQVAGEIQQARSKAIMGNVNVGMTFAIVDADSYRWVSDDALQRTPVDDPYVGALHDLPFGIRFVAVAGGSTAVRYTRLGTACIPGVGSCGAAFPQAFCSAAETTVPSRCLDSPMTVSNTYISAPNVTTGAVTITVREMQSTITRTIQVAPGGRVLTQQ